jgi:argininosuccinate lyase/amino-acid N-acetyltransferase
MSEHDTKAPAAGRLWGGGFETAPDPLLDRFCASFACDRRLLRADVECNRAWVAALQEAGVVGPAEAARLDEALRAIAERPIPAGAEAEDVHSYVEAALAERVGADLAGRLRTGRSRNDLAATGLRLFCREEIGAQRRALAASVAALADLAGRCGALAVPGYTHLRRAQPILLAHLLLAHAERLMRDDDRFVAALGRLDACPLGSGALAGTTLPIDRQALARRLGFSRACANSLDAVSDRDFVADALHAAALTMIHLSQIAEDLILATAEEFGWLALEDAAATGSSLMPQKKNPDALELLRGRAGRVAGRLAGFLTALKGLPAAYNRDLQEDKEALFDALDTTRDSLAALGAVLLHLAPAPARGLDRGGDAGGLLATDLADYLAGKGVPFAEAHRLAGEAAARARREGRALRDLPLETLRSLSPRFDADLRDWLSVGASLARRDVEGGTAPGRVAAALARVRAWVAERAAAPRGTGAPPRDPGAPPRSVGALHVSDPAVARLPAGGDCRPRIDPGRVAAIEPAAAADLPALEARIRHWAGRGVLLPLDGPALRAALPDFRVVRSPDGSGLLAFGALRRYSPALAEIRSLVVADPHARRGLGRRLVAHLLDEARRGGTRRVFVLTRTPGFFDRLGFARVPRESLPEKVFKDCATCTRRERCDEHALVLEL